MNYSAYQIRRCMNETCSLRYPLLVETPHKEDCPRCGGCTEALYTGNILKEKRHAHPVSQGIALEGLLDNIRSTWNVGSMFRTADGFGLGHLYLCGITPTPEHVKVAKTALGAEMTIPWSYHADGVRIARTLKEEGALLWGMEEDRSAVVLQQTDLPTKEKRIVLVVGNEITGVDPGILELCDRVLHIPMRGIKRSLNAAVAFGIASFYLASALSQPAR